MTWKAATGFGKERVYQCIDTSCIKSNSCRSCHAFIFLLVPFRSFLHQNIQLPCEKDCPNTNTEGALPSGVLRSGIFVLAGHSVSADCVIFSNLVASPCQALAVYSHGPFARSSGQDKSPFACDFCIPWTRSERVGNGPCPFSPK